MTAPPRARVDTPERSGEGNAGDPYAWLRSPRWRDILRVPQKLEGDIRAHLEAENRYAEAVLAPAGDLRRRIREELEGRIKQQDASVPESDGPFAYYLRYAPGGQHPLYCRRRREPDAPEEILVDGNLRAEGTPFFRVAGAVHSPDHRYFAFAVDTTGSEHHELCVVDLRDGSEQTFAGGNLSGDLAWANDSRTIVYTVLDSDHRASRVEAVDTQSGDVALVCEEADPAFHLHVHRMQSRRFIAVSAQDHADTTEVRLIDADAPGQGAQLLAERRPGLSLRPAERDGVLYLLTNEGEAVDYRIVAATATFPLTGERREIVPHRPGTLITRMLVFADHLVRLELADACPRIVVRAFETGDEHVAPLPEDADAAYHLDLAPGYEFATTVLRFVYSSPRHPRRTYDYDMASGDLTLRKTQEVPSGHDSDAYAVSRFVVSSHDGAEVPVTLLHRRDTPPDATRPLLLYGYGAYGMSIPASFGTDRLSLVDRGIAFAIAHVRGGSERGYRWYLDGKLARKTNTFDDFIAVANHLVAQGLVQAGGIVANGRSAGGMLMGVIANRRPDLFKAVVAEVPFVDVLNTMRDADLPLTPPEWSEWGNPVADEDAFRRIASYSPYDTIRPQRYPHILATGGIADPRVTYWEPAKWIARLRANATGDARIVLHMNMSAGHGGSAGRFARLDEVALVQSFILMVCERTDRAPSMEAESSPDAHDE